MAAPLVIRYVRHPDYLPGDHLELEVDNAVQGDRIVPWGPDRALVGFGLTAAIQAPFGLGPALPFGEGGFGYGRFGLGAEIVVHRTLRPYVAGDYDVRLRSVDQLGNASAWNTAATVKHRPKPPAPRALRLDGAVLRWDFSDP